MTPPLGELEQLVLLAVLQLGDDAYAVPIRTLLDERADRRLSRGALYTVLDRLEQKGCLRSRLGESRPERGGRPRRYYRVQPVGVRSLRASLRTRAALTQGLESVLRDL